MDGYGNNPYNSMGYQNNAYNRYNSGAYGPKQQITFVNGREGANMYSIGPDSSAALMDTSGNILWIIKTDGAGYKAIQPYDIVPHVEPTPPDFNALLTRMSKMEEVINGLVAANNNTRATQQPAECVATNSSSTTTGATTGSTDTIAKQF